MTDLFDSFTESARNVLMFADEEAASLRHNYLGTEHILLGLIRDEEGIAVAVLGQKRITLARARDAVQYIVGLGEREFHGERGITPRVKKVIEYSFNEAREFGHEYVGTEHLFLGLLREGEGIAAGILETLGTNLPSLRIATLEAIADRAKSRGE